MDLLKERAVIPSWCLEWSCGMECRGWLRGGGNCRLAHISAVPGGRLARWRGTHEAGVHRHWAGLGRVYVLLQHYRETSVHNTRWPGDGGTSPLSQIFGSLPSSNSIVPPLTMTSLCSSQFLFHC